MVGQTKLGLVLHFYQPAEQKSFIVNGVAGQVYHPVLDGILKAAKGRVTINLTGSLLDQLVHYKHDDLIEKFREVARQGLVEYVASGQYHAILPLLPPEEAKRQIALDIETYHRVLGPEFTPRGLFLPEMAWAPTLVPVLEELGLEYVLLDELSYNGKVNQVDFTKSYPLKDSKITALFREHRISDTFMSAGARTVDSFKTALGTDLGSGRYIIAASDGETFGHHRVGLQELLFGLLGDNEIEMVRLNDLVDELPKSEPITTIAAGWASSEDDLANGIPYISWNDPENPIHAWQWELMHLAIDSIKLLNENDAAYGQVRHLLDLGESSDQFFWAAGRPFWMIDYIESGAADLRNSIAKNPSASDNAKQRAHELYDIIVGTAFEWQKTGKLDKAYGERDAVLRIPFKERTADAGGEGEAIYNAFMKLMQDAEADGVTTKNYEAAIMWRDAQYKLEHRTDVYDSFHVVDILRQQLGDAKVDAMLEQYRAEYNRIRGGQSEQRTN